MSMAARRTCLSTSYLPVHFYLGFISGNKNIVRLGFFSGTQSVIELSFILMNQSIVELGSISVNCSIINMITVMHGQNQAP